MTEQEIKTMLDKLVQDESWQVRSALAVHGVGLDVLINDKKTIIRELVAEQGYGLEILINDPEIDVRMAAASSLAKRFNALKRENK